MGQGFERIFTEYTGRLGDPSNGCHWLWIGKCKVVHG